MIIRGLRKLKRVLRPAKPIEPTELEKYIAGFRSRGVHIDPSFFMSGILKTESPSYLADTRFVGINSVGAFSYMAGGANIYNSVIGRYCSIAESLRAGLGDHEIYGLSTHPILHNDNRGLWASDLDGYLKVMFKEHSNVEAIPTEIGHDVWIGARCTILGEVKIGNGAVIAAGSVVTKDVAPYSVTGGVPAKHIKWRFSEEVRSRLIESQWWEWDIATIQAQDYSDVHSFLDHLERAVGNGVLTQLRPISGEFKK